MDDNNQNSPPSGPTTILPSRSFRGASIAFAVDTSGSTEGIALEMEKEAIQRIASLLPPHRRGNIMVLPWNDRCESLIRINDINSLRSDGGTDPAVLFDTSQNRMALSEAHFWFLMTDGLIYPQEIRNFASKITQHGMHGKACIITIVGYKEALPGQSNISVGLSVFAMSPHVAVLFQDIASGAGQVYILGVKGCFTELLRPGESSPKLSNSTRWEDLPRTSFENLTRVAVPPPQAVSQEEIILEGGRVNLDDLFGQTEVPDDFLANVLDNTQNQHTLSLAAKSLGKTQELHTWLDRVDQKIDMMDIDTVVDPPTEQEDPQGSSVDQIIAELMSHKMDAKTKAEAQRRLSNANESWERSRNSSEAQGVASIHHHRRSSTSAMRRASVSGLDTAQNNLTYTVTPMQPIIQPGPTKKLFNPGFSNPTKLGDCVRGICMLCARSDVLLCLHFVKPPTSLQTSGLSKPGSLSRLRYPLAMGNFPETDIISNFLSCDPCSARLLKKPGKTLHGETIVANLPLVVCDGSNRDAWLETLGLTTERRFAADDLLAVFLAILATKVERSPDEQSRKSMLRFILDWCCRMLLREGDASVFESDDSDEDENDDAGDAIPKKRTLHTQNFAHNYSGACRIPLQENLRHDFDTATMPSRRPNTLLTYPLDGFIVANVVLSNSMLKTAISHDRRRMIVWTRFLYRLVEIYHEFCTREASSLVDTATSLLLLQTADNTRSNLFRLENMRLLTIHKERHKPSSPGETSSSESSTIDFFRSIGALLSTRSQRFRLAFRPSGDADVGLAGTPFLGHEDLADFERLGPLFSWISDEAGHALALFLNWLLRVGHPFGLGGDGMLGNKVMWRSSDSGDEKNLKFESPEERFSWLRRHPSLKLVFQDPRAVSPRFVEENIKDLPALR